MKIKIKLTSSGEKVEEPQYEVEEILEMDFCEEVI
jgi:hypothetical protein